ncbi:hypothetical protein GQ53DRAFT_855245 [Thozetella sp. PMI_491]|nr:hypothetical protein GQ53DRAFT_855245 [Thozetella sp. PMI_491]
MAATYDIEVFYRPGINLSEEAKRALQTDICSLATAYLRPLPRYQVFDTASPTALDDKVIVTIHDRRGEDGKNLVAFVSGVLIPIEGLQTPVLHTGITAIHSQHRKSSVKRLLFANLFVSVLSEYPSGVWLTSLAEVLTSLVHIAKYSAQAFPSPQWARERGSTKPSSQHLKIAREINSKHRAKMCISPTARFDEERFIFLGSNDWPEGRVFMKDVDDQIWWHRDIEATQFFSRLFRRGAGDEVLQVAFLDMFTLYTNMEKEGFADNQERIVSKVSALLRRHRMACKSVNKHIAIVTRLLLEEHVKKKFV